MTSRLQIFSARSILWAFVVPKLILLFTTTGGSALLSLINLAPSSKIEITSQGKMEMAQPFLRTKKQALGSWLVICCLHSLWLDCIRKRPNLAGHWKKWANFDLSCCQPVGFISPSVNLLFILCSRLCTRGLWRPDWPRRRPRCPPSRRSRNLRQVWTNLVSRIR